MKLYYSIYLTLTKYQLEIHVTCSKYTLWWNMRHLVVSSVVSLAWSHPSMQGVFSLIWCDKTFDWRWKLSESCVYYYWLISALHTCKTNLVRSQITWIVRNQDDNSAGRYTLLVQSKDRKYSMLYILHMKSSKCLMFAV